MSTTSIPEGLRPYVPPSLYQGDSLKPGIDVDQAIQIAQGIQAKAEALPPAQAQVFLAMVRAVDIAPGGEIPADIDVTLEAMARASGAISGSPVWRDVIDVLARAMIEQAAEQRQNALNDRLNARDQAKTELLSQAESLKDQASELKDGAKSAMILSIVFSSLSIVAAGVSIVGGGLGGVGSSDGVRVVAKGGQVGNALYGSSQGATSIGGSLGQIGQSSSGYETTSAQATAKEMEAQGQIDAAQAQEMQNVADLKKEMQDSMNDMIKSIIAFLKELSDAKAQQMQVMTKV